MTTVEDLAVALAGERPEAVLAASWDVLDLAQRVADAVTWEEGFDELHAMAAAEACASGLAGLLPPGDGQPVGVPGDPSIAVAPCVELLELAARRLTAVAQREPASASRLRELAGHAAGAGRALKLVRE
jgi:hypothetical protein